MSDYTLADGSASISGELSLLAEKEYIMPLSKKDTTESLKTALYELLMRKEEVEQLQKDNKAQQEVVDKLVEVLRGCACEYDNEWGDGSEGSGSKELRDLISSIGEDE